MHREMGRCCQRRRKIGVQMEMRDNFTDESKIRGEKNNYETDGIETSKR